LNDSEKLNQFANLLKQYQEEVDKLTKSRKTAEQAFLSVYKLLANAPDPVMGITAALVCIIYFPPLFVVISFSFFCKQSFFVLFVWICDFVLFTLRTESCYGN
jgi:hypothetical protein